jgi:hypothetical protein
MAGVTPTLQMQAIPGQQRRSAHGGEISDRDGQPEEHADFRAVHDTENQAAHQPHC